MLLLVFKTGLQCCRVSGSPYNTVLVEKVLVLSHRLIFSKVSLGSISDANLTVRPLLSHENLTVRPLPHM
jgi:hypothetical protein